MITLEEIATYHDERVKANLGHIAWHKEAMELLLQTKCQLEHEAELRTLRKHVVSLVERLAQ